jgi:glycosyltransferase involved in cell wall biosynthesis
MHLIKTGVGARWALRQIKVLINQGAVVHVVLSEDGPMLAEYVAVGATVHLLPIDVARIRPWDLLGALHRFRSLVEQVAPDLIHSHFVGTTLFMRFSLRHRRDLPRLFQVPGPLHLEKLLPRQVELACSNATDYWVGTCQLTGDLYSSFGVPADRLFISYYGTSVGQMLPPGRRDCTRKDLKLSPDTKAIGMVAFMYPPRRWIGQKTGLKGHEDLIDAIRILLDEGRDVLGVFVGGAWGAAEWYEQRVRDYGAERLGNRALFLGTRSDVAALYEAIDVAVHPSHSENVGGAVESLLLGVPTVASAIGGFPDVVINGETGYLAPAKNPIALAKAIARMLDNPDQAAVMARAGKERCMNLFDVDRTGCEMIEIYKTIIQRHRSVT